MATGLEATASGNAPVPFIAPIVLSSIQSLVQLSIALNAAYFTFRSGNRPAYDNLARDLDEVGTTISTHNLYDVEKINHDLANAEQDVRDFESRRDRFYRFLDAFMLYIGYGLALLGILALLLCSIFPLYELQYGWVLLLTSLLYAPVSIAITMEVILGTMCLRCQHKVVDLSRNCEYSIAQVESPQR